MVTVIGGPGGGWVLAQHQTATITTGRWPLFVLGLVLMAAGIFIRLWAIVTLGRFFTSDVRVHADQTVVARGPYRWLRHPSYFGLIIFFVGLGLALSSWASLVWLALVPTAGLVVRINSEERALLDLGCRPGVSIFVGYRGENPTLTIRSDEVGGSGPSGKAPAECPGRRTREDPVWTSCAC